MATNPITGGQNIFPEDMPIEVKRYIISNFQAFRLDGFDNHGRCVEIVMTKSTMARWALFESMRRTLQVSEESRPVHNTAPIPEDELED